LWILVLGICLANQPDSLKASKCCLTSHWWVVNFLSSAFLLELYRGDNKHLNSLFLCGILVISGVRRCVFSWLVKKRQIHTHRRPQLKMLSSEDVFKNTVLPSRVISTGVNSPDGVHWAHGHTCYIHEINGTSEVEVDTASKMQKPLPGKGVSSRSTGRGLNDISRLQSDSAAEINRLQHWRHRPPPRPRKWHLRTVSDISQGGMVGPHRQHSLQEFQNDIHHAATETYLITRLALTLLRYLGVGTRWLSRLARLYLYALFLSPGFIQVGFDYYFSKNIHRSIVYGDQPRNR
jgi:hypothetical protein